MNLLANTYQNVLANAASALGLYSGFSRPAWLRFPLDHNTPRLNINPPKI
jgi:hypothetical protein